MMLPTAVGAQGFGEGFAAFTMMHLWVVLVSAGAMGLLCWLGRRFGRRFEIAWAWVIVATQILHNAWWLWWSMLSDENPDAGIAAYLEAGLPLQLCDLAAPTAAIVMFFGLRPGFRWSRSLLYFWGIGLSSWAFFTPVLTTGPEHILFWTFWINHVQIVGTAVYDLLIRGYRPGWKDLRTTVLISFVWALVVQPLNFFAGANYGFMGEAGAAGSPIEALGSWPLRLLPLAAIVLTGLVGLRLAAGCLPKPKDDEASS